MPSNLAKESCFSSSRRLCREETFSHQIKYLIVSQIYQYINLKIHIYIDVIEPNTINLSSNVVYC